MSAENEIYGTLVEFKDPDQLVRAAKIIYRSGFRRLDAFSPFPIEGLAEAIGFSRESVALIALLGGIMGGVLGFGMQWYCNSIDYPINVAGRPDFSWPAFIPVTFELTVLGAALAGAFGMLVLNRLPKPWHPVFNLAAFDRASRDRFFLCIQARDPIYDLKRIDTIVSDFHPVSIQEVKYEE